MDPSTHAHRPSLGIIATRETNQIANFTMVEWGDNAKITAQPPAKYVPILSGRFSTKALERMYYWHALPDGWQEMEYRDFLRERRELMARVIRDAYHTLSGDGNESTTAPIPLEAIVKRFDDFDRSRVLIVECSPAKSPAFVKDGSLDRFYMRTGAATAKLSGAQAHEYIKQRFGA